MTYLVKENETLYLWIIAGFKPISWSVQNGAKDSYVKITVYKYCWNTLVKSLYVLEFKLSKNTFFERNIKIKKIN